MEHNERIAQDIIKKLDQCVGDLAYIGLYDLADRLQEIIGDAEEKMMQEGHWVEGDHRGR